MWLDWDTGQGLVGGTLKDWEDQFREKQGRDDVDLQTGTRRLCVSVSSIFILETRLRYLETIFGRLVTLR
jgi:hypothetical protein